MLNSKFTLYFFPIFTNNYFYLTFTLFPPPPYTKYREQTIFKRYHSVRSGLLSFSIINQQRRFFSCIT